MTDSYVRTIVNLVTETQGSAREYEVFSKPHSIIRTETWNNLHKVVDVISDIPDETGHCNSYSVDVVTEKICG